jgi:hypothetical protein
MKKLVLLVSVLSLFSCSNSEDVQIVPEVPTVVSVLSYASGGGGEKKDYFISNNNLDKVIYSNGYSDIYSYSSGEISKITKLTPNGSVLVTTELFYLSGQLNYILIDYPDYNTKTKETFTFTGNNVLVDVVYINKITGSIESGNDYSMEINSGNVMSFNNGYGVVESFTYDNGFNLFSTLTNIEELVLLNKGKFGINNIVSLDSQEDFTFVNDYNSSNKLITKKKYDQNNVLMTTETFTY